MPHSHLSQIKVFTFSHLLKITWKAFKKNIKIITVFAILYVVIFAMRLIPICMMEGQSNFYGESYNVIKDSSIAFLIAMVVYGIVVFVLNLFADTYLVNGVINKIKWKKNIFVSLDKIGRVGVTVLVQVLFLFGLTLLFIIPGIIFSIYWMFATQSSILFGKQGGEALSHSKSVVEGKWWKVFGYMFLFGIFIFMGMIALEMIFNVIFSIPSVDNFLISLSDTSVFIFDIVYQITLNILIVPLVAFFFVFQAFFFLNLCDVKKYEDSLKVLSHGQNNKNHTELKI